MTKVRYKRLRKYWGWAYINEDKIDLYHKLKGKKHLEIILHEKLHLIFPDHDEKAIKRISKDICNLLWLDGYRKL
jgi:hypothetical protein